MSSKERNNLVIMLSFSSSLHTITRKRSLKNISYINRYFKVYIVSHEDMPKFIRKRKAIKLLYFFLAPLLFKAVRKCNIILVSGNGMILAFFSKLFFPKSKIFAEYHFRYNNFFYKITDFLIKYFTDGIIIQTHSLGKHLYPFYSRNKKYDKLLYIPNHANTKIFHPFQVPIKDKSIKDEFIIGWVGFLNKHKWISKNIESLFKAITLLPESLRKITLLKLVGHVTEAIKKYLQKKYPKVNVTFTGVVANEDLPQYYNNFSLFILPSTHEGSAKVLLEALGCGCLIIVNDLEELKEVIRHNENGLVIDCNDPVKLKNAIYELVNDPEKRIRLRNNAYLDRKKYNNKILLTRESKFIKSLL
ncbi:MAG: glycosyltransferase family 4 protein [Promethearchaeota archaeon]